jgi:hypothetical protein
LGAIKHPVAVRSSEGRLSFAHDDLIRARTVAHAKDAFGAFVRRVAGALAALRGLVNDDLYVGCMALPISRLPSVSVIRSSLTVDIVGRAFRQRGNVHPRVVAYPTARNADLDTLKADNPLRPTLFCSALFYFFAFPFFL